MNRRTVLKGGFVLAATAHTAAFAPPIADPLLNLIRDYRKGLSDFYADTPDAELDGLADRTYGPHLARIDQWEGPALTREGAIEALKVSIEDVGGVADRDSANRMVRAALGYLETLTV